MFQIKIKYMITKNAVFWNFLSWIGYVFEDFKKTKYKDIYFGEEVVTMSWRSSLVSRGLAFADNPSNILLRTNNICMTFIC